MISQEEFLDWKAHRVTKAVLAVLTAKMEEGKAEWAEGRFMGDDLARTAIRNAAAIGKMQALQGLVEFDYDTLLAETANE
jgi:hypothetical protein